MSRAGSGVDAVVRVFNAGVSALLRAPVVGPLMGRGTTTISYTGRRSGRTFSTPVSFRRHGDTLTIRVMAAGGKNWWRNFQDGGWPATLQLDGVGRTGHAVAVRDDGGRVTVQVTLDPGGR